MSHIDCPQCNRSLTGVEQSCPDCGCSVEASIISSAEIPVRGRAVFSIMMLAIGSAFILLYLAL